MQLRVQVQPRRIPACCATADHLPTGCNCLGSDKSTKSVRYHEQHSVPPQQHVRQLGGRQLQYKKLLMMRNNSAFSKMTSCHGVSGLPMAQRKAQGHAPPPSRT